MNPKFLKTTSVIVLILILVIPHMAIALSQTTIPELKPGYTRAYISPILLDDEFWKHGAYVEDSSLLSIGKPDPVEFEIADVEFGQVLIIMSRTTSPIVLKGKVLGLIANLPTHMYNVVIAWITRDQLNKLGSTPGVLAILPDIRLDVLVNKEQKVLRELLDKDPVLAEILEAGGSGQGTHHYTVEVTGAYDVWTQYGIRGEGVKLAIIDTGVDYGSPGLGLEAIARDEYGLPLIFDASSLGLVLTPVKATVLTDGYIRVNYSDLYVFQPPYYVFRWTNRLYVRFTGCGGRSGWLTVPHTWYIGNITFNPSVPIKFGLAYQYISTSLGTLYYTIPVIVVDSSGDGYYDTLYADTTTALYLVRWALAVCNVTIPGKLGTTPDFSFADEEPITYGNEVIARDLDGDGIRDYSVGALAGYVYDAAFVILLEKLGTWKELMPQTQPLYGYPTASVIMYETWRYEPVAMVWPGLDPYGDYVVLEYDYHSHGTYCANTAAGRDFYAQTGYGARSISGQAPAAKIAASPALYFGTTAVSIYFFSGFDLATPYGDGSRYLWPNLLVNPWIAFEGYEWTWVYTGEHQVDITSNSWGISGWALWGWNTGSDPYSVIYDYTILTSGTMHFVAVGNGGPGYGTVSSPASSSFAIGVGAATEFTYRPLYGYWPGSSRDVITWSNRGPTELGVVKPDVLAIGSFAWAVGRTWDALGNVYGIRRLSGWLAYNLFSGTSQATPMAAGVGALVVSAYKAKYESRMPPYLLKTILMNTAKDTGFDELSQGAGFVNAYRAVTAVLDPSFPKVYSTDFARDVFSELELNYAAITYGEFTEIAGSWFEPKIFIPLVKTYETRKLTIEGAGTYRVYPARLVAVETRDICSAITSGIDLAGCSGDTVYLNVTAATVYAHVFIDPSTLTKYDFFEIEAVYPYEYFESGGRSGNYTLLIGSSILDFAYWIDVGADGVFSWSETGRITYDIRRANALRIQSGRLSEKLAEIEALAERYIGVNVSSLPKYLVLRIGVSGATFRGILPIKIRIVGYKLSPWSDVRVSPSILTVTSGSRVVNVTVSPTPLRGFHSGYIVVEEITKKYRYLVPISYFIPLEITSEYLYKITPYTENTPRKNTYIRGAFDYTWRYESGDWRVFKVIVSPSLTNIWALGVRVTWPIHGNTNYASNLDVHVYGPYTYYMVDEAYNVYTYSVNTVQLAAELTRDPAGGSRYNPTRFWDAYKPGESIIVAPVSGPGVYRVVVRNIQYRGLFYNELFTLEVFPITLRTVYSYNANTKTYTYLVTIKTPGYSMQTLPQTLTPTREAIYVTNMVYIPDISNVGISVSASINRVDYTTGLLYATIQVKHIDTTPRGIYMIPLSTVFSVPVTTCGWLEGGNANIYSYHNEIPLVITVKI